MKVKTIPNEAKIDFNIVRGSVNGKHSAVHRNGLHCRTCMKGRGFPRNILQNRPSTRAFYVPGIPIAIINDLTL